MSAMLTQPDLSDIISLKALQIIDSIVTMLRVQQMTEMKEREKKKNLDIESSDSDDDHHRNLFNRGPEGKIDDQDFEEDEDEKSDSEELNDDENENFDDEGIDFSKENEEVCL